MNNKTIFQSKKAILLIIALINLNVIFFTTPFLKMPIEISVNMITAILFLVGIGVGVQGGIDMIQSNKLDMNTLNSKAVEDKKYTENKKEEKIIRVEYANSKEKDYKI